jgi:hypothetical protein
MDTRGDAGVVCWRGAGQLRIVGGVVSRHEFMLRPSKPEHEGVLRALDGLEGFSSRLEPDGYFHVHVEAASFDEAQYKLRDVVDELQEPVTLSAPVVLERRSDRRSD